MSGASKRQKGLLDVNEAMKTLIRLWYLDRADQSLHCLPS